MSHANLNGRIMSNIQKLSSIYTMDIKKADLHISKIFYHFPNIPISTLYTCLGFSGMLWSSEVAFSHFLFQLKSFSFKRGFQTESYITQYEAGRVGIILKTGWVFF